MQAISKMTPEMMFEEIDICFQTGRCPRCDAALNFHFEDDEWEIECSNPCCKGFWAGGGSWGNE